MAIIKQISIYAAPKRLLEYVTNKNKTDEGTLVTGLCCSSNPDVAYDEMQWGFEQFAKERFFKKAIPLDDEKNEDKQKVRLHHYIQSFKPNEVTPEEAHTIGVEWAKKVFGENRQIIVATHIDKGHIHNHFAVLPYDIEGNHWISNKQTMRKCRRISDKIAKAHGLSVIEKSKYKANHKYGEYMARKNNLSWKQKLCDDIDSIIVNPDVRSIDDLTKMLEAKGYKINKGKYLSVKANENSKPIRTYRLGDGYSLEHLKYRIENKNLEMPLSEISKYHGIQKDCAICIRQIQIEIYRKPEKERLYFATYREIENSSKLLNFMNDNEIISLSDFEKMISDKNEKIESLKSDKKEIAEKIKIEERLISDLPKYLELRNKTPKYANDIHELAKYSYIKHMDMENKEDIEFHKQSIKLLKSKLINIEESIGNEYSERKEFYKYYNQYMVSMKTDYEILLDKAKLEEEQLREAQYQNIEREENQENEQERL